MGQWTVWVGGTEVTDYYINKETAEQLAASYVANGHDDVIIERKAEV